MPENLHDTPASAEQDALFKTDPTNSQAKPYSRLQREANAANKGRAMLYHKEHGEEVFTGEEVELALKNGWRDTPYVHPNCPDKAMPDDEAEEAPAKDMELEALWAEVDRLKIKPRPPKNTGKAKLMAAIEKASG